VNRSTGCSIRGLIHVQRGVHATLDEQHDEVSVVLRANHYLAGVLDLVCGQCGPAGEIHFQRSYLRVLPCLSKQRTCAPHPDGLQLGLIRPSRSRKQSSRISKTQQRQSACGHTRSCQDRPPAKPRTADGLITGTVLLGKGEIRLGARGAALVNLTGADFQGAVADRLG
jgi:hypothetical protein